MGSGASSGWWRSRRCRPSRRHGQRLRAQVEAAMGRRISCPGRDHQGCGRSYWRTFVFLSPRAFKDARPRAAIARRAASKARRGARSAFVAMRSVAVGVFPVSRSGVRPRRRRERRTRPTGYSLHYARGVHDPCLHGLECYPVSALSAPDSLDAPSLLEVDAMLADGGRHDSTPQRAA